MKILIVTERFYPEEFIVNGLAEDWVAKGLQVDVLTQAPSYPQGKVFPGYTNDVFSSENWKGINIFRYFTVTGYRDSLFLKLLNYTSYIIVGTLAALFKARGYDRILVYQTGPLTVALPAVFARKIYRIPVTIWTQDIWPDMVYAYGFRKTRFLDWILSLIIRFVYNNCDTILVSCDGFAKRISEFLPGRQMKQFPNWATVSPDGGSDKASLPDGFNFTFAGNVGKLQNLENVLRGFGIAVKKQPELKLNIVGDGSYLETLKEITKTEGIQGVFFWGRKKMKEMPAYFRASDAMIISLNNTPGLNITVPSKFPVYLSFGKPLLCAMSGEVRELVERYKLGICAGPDSPAEISEAFLRLYAARGRDLDEYAANALRLEKAKYSREHISAGIRAAVTGDAGK